LNIEQVNNTGQSHSPHALSKASLGQFFTSPVLTVYLKKLANHSPKTHQKLRTHSGRPLGLNKRPVRLFQHDQFYFLYMVLIKLDKFVKYHREKCMKLNVNYILPFVLSSLLLGCASDDDPAMEEDILAPTISLVGEATVTLTVGDSYEEPGSAVTDNIDSGLTANVTGSVDTSTEGTYVLTYTSVDLAGNSSSVTRTIIVEPQPDTEAPEIVLIGDAEISLAYAETYVEQGVTVSDNVDSGLSAISTGTVDVNIAGSYVLTYTATDTANNQSSVTRTVIVAEEVVVVETNAFIFHSGKDDSFSMEFWGDTWGTDTTYTDQPTDSTYPKALEISKSTAWGTIVAWGNEPENTVDISAYTHAKFKVKSDTFNSVQVFVQSASAPETSFTYSFASATDLGNGWVELQAILPNFTDMTWFSLNFIGDAGTTVLLADVYFTALEAEPVAGPPVGAPMPPDYADNEVTVLYSDSLAPDSFIGLWNANWWNAPIYVEGNVNGNNFAKYQITAGGIEGGVTGLEFGFENGELDASDKTTWNFDLFVEPGITKIELQLVSKDGGAKYIIENPTTDAWVSYDLLYSELIDNDAAGPQVLNSALLQSIGIALHGPEGTSLYVDNIYFSGLSTSYDLTVTVVDDNNTPLANAEISVGEISAITDSSGVATLNLPEGEHKVVVDASGFGLNQGNKVIAGGDTTLAISVNPLNSGPIAAAPAPSATDAEAFVLYSDALTVDKPISYWSDNWWNAPTFSEVTIEGNKTARFQIIPDGVSGGVTGIQYGIQNGVIDVSTATGLRFDMYATAGITQAVYQIVSASGPGISTMLPVPTEQWISVELPFSALVDPTGNFNPAVLNQFGLQLWGTTSDAVYIDNIYFY
jgi:hypothetical protein